MQIPSTLTRLARVGVAAVLGVGLLQLGAGLGRADTAPVEFSQSGTFWRLQQRAVRVDIPCPPAPLPQDRCGPTNPSPVEPTPPNVVEGNMVVAHAGGPTGADKGDMMWAALEADVAAADPEATVDQFTLRLFVAPDRRGDFNVNGDPAVKACNIVAFFAVSPGTNPWDDRPSLDCATAKAPTISSVNGMTAYTFDLTDFAQTWVKGTGFGVAIVPGRTEQPANINNPNNGYDVPPFQVTFATPEKVDALGKPHPARPQGTFAFTPAETFEEEGGFGDLGGDDFSDFGGDLGAEGGELDGSFGGEEPLDDFGGTDTGDVGDAGVASEEEAGPSPDGDGSSTQALGTRRLASSKTGFPWYLLLLLPFGLFAFWGSSTALGEAGEPVPTRTGGVSRVLERRRAAGTPSSPVDTRG